LQKVGHENSIDAPVTEPFSVTSQITETQKLDIPGEKLSLVIANINGIAELCAR
jgi:hypothetical protein